MRKLSALLALMLLGSLGTSSAQDCLHGQAEPPAQKLRRDQALSLAARINIAPRMAAPGLQNRRYRRLEELANIPATPQGFELRFYTDGDTYSFALKDRLDPCHYAVFSDEERDIYEAVVRRGAMLVPLETRR